MSNMLFSTTAAQQAAPKKESLFLDAGIHENVKLTNIRIDKSANGSDYIEFTFTNLDGRHVKQTYYTPTRFENQNDEQFQNTVNARINAMTEIFECYYPKGSQTKIASTYLEYITWVKQILEVADKSQMLRVKAVYKNNGYVSLPEGSFYPFIEKMDANPIRVVKMQGDRFERITPDKEENKSDDSTTRFLTSSEIGDGTTGMPF